MNLYIYGITIHRKEYDERLILWEVQLTPLSVER